jgi:acetyl esterase/lipase
MRKQILLGIALASVGLCAVASLAFRENIAFYVKLLQAIVSARRFYAGYPHLARDVAFHAGMEPRLDVYSPPEGSGYPVVVFVHGGSWKDYDKKLFAPVAMRLLPEGMVVVIPDYTLHPGAGYEQMAGEVAAALSWTLENIERYGGDPQAVVVAGHSAGAHLTGLALLDPRFLGAYDHSSDEFCGWIGLSGVYDVQAEYDYWQGMGRTPKVMAEVMGGQENFAEASPLNYVRPDLPPILLIHGDQDRTVPLHIATDLHAALQAAGADSTLAIYPESGHSDYLFAALAEEQSRVVDDIAGFVRRCTRPAP